MNAHDMPGMWSGGEVYSEEGRDGSDDLRGAVMPGSDTGRLVENAKEGSRNMDEEKRSKLSESIRIIAAPTTAAGVILYGVGLAMLVCENDVAAGVCLIVGTVLMIGIFIAMIKVDRR
jgi:hypothetical protein